MRLQLTVIFTAGLCLALPFAGAQTIRGRVTDSLQHPLTGATVRLETTATKVVLTTASDTAGRFVFHPANGQYRARATMMGYQAAVYGPFVFNGTLSLPDIRLQVAPDSLRTVNVTARQPLAAQKIDRTVIDVSGLTAATGSNVLELLQKLPGVTVDNDGNIGLQGKSGVMVLIDDKPTYLSADALAAYLRGLPASSLAQVELMDNPPAQYDAAGNAGAINLRMKKQKKAGLNGTASASYRLADYGTSFESLNLNYRQGKISLYTNASFNDQHTSRTLNLQRNYLDDAGNTRSLLDQTSFFSPVSHNGNLQLGADYAVSPKTTISLTLSGTLSSVGNHNPVSGTISHPSGQQDSVIHALNTSDSRFDRGAMGLDYRHRFDGEGQNLSISFDRLDYYTHANEVFASQTYSPPGQALSTQTLTDNLPVNIHITSGKTDYSQPLGKTAGLDMGLKSSLVNTDNAANYFDLTNCNLVPDENLSNRFLYHENINAAYVSFHQRFSRFELQAGFRLENTNSSGHQLGNTVQPDSSFSRHYTNLFPTLYLLRKLDSAGNSSLVFSYGRRIDRPYYQDLNPFTTLIDQFTYFSGNPFLRPSFTSNYKLELRYRGMLTIAAAYQQVADIPNETVTQQGDIFISRVANIGDYKWYALTVNLQLNPAPWWSCNAYLELSRNHYLGMLGEITLFEQSNYVGGNCYNQFTLGNGWTAELSAFYNGPHGNAQFTRIGTGQVSTGLQKSLWHKKGNIRLNVNDLLHSYTAAGTITGIPGALANYHNTYDSRWMSLGLNYSFGSDNKDRNRENSADEEAGRVKN